MAEAYVHPEVLVSADWVAEHLDDPKVRIVESDEDVLLYDMGHIPGSVKIDWQGDLQDQLIRDYIDADKFAAICSKAGIAQRHDGRLLRRQVELVGLLRPLGVQALRPPGLPDLNGGPEALDRREAADHDRGPALYPDRSTPPSAFATRPRSGRSATRFWPIRSRASRSSTSGARRSSPASGPTWRIIPTRDRSGAATSRAPSASPGLGRSTTTGPSRPPTS